MKKITQFLFTTVVMLFTTIAFSQSTVSGTVMDADMNAPLPGANIVEKGTTNGTTTDFDGNFTLEAKSSSGEVVVSYVGYSPQTFAFSGNQNLGTITMVGDNTLEEIVIVGSGIIDLAEDRKTPIAVSTLKASEIQDRTGNFDLPEILKSTPSVHNVKGGGFGDGSMFLRGFDQTNTAFLLNGQPINGMEDGKMYWSNWSGVLDIANAVQVQRGLGSSKLAISSVGGTVNIVTKTIDKKQGGFIQQMVGNGNYSKSTAYISTGLLESGWAFSAMLGHWQGDGYVQHTGGQGQTYFISLGYKPNDSNIFNFLLTGAPQWHAAAGSGRLSEFLDNGRKYNSWNRDDITSPNNLSSGVYPGGRNIYHKPIANLNWDWTINETSSLSTVLYGSIGRGQFGVLIGDDYVRGSNNNHNWYGLVTNYSNALNENLDLNVGADIRMYNGIHFRGVTEFLTVNSVSASSALNGDYEMTDAFGGINPWNVAFNPNDAHDQRFGYDYEEKINYAGVFGQLEYSKDKFSTFFQGAVSTQSHVREGFFVEEGLGESEKITNPGFNIKAGVAYELNDSHTIFANGGYYSRQPYHDDLFINTRTSNQLNPYGEENQKITGLEAGYKFTGDNVGANLNFYYTTWDNRILFDSDDTNDDNVADVFYQSSPVKQVHMGAELEVFARPSDKLDLTGFVSVGDWTYDGDVTTSSYDDDNNLISEGDPSYIDGHKIGNAAQLTAGVGVNYEIAERFSFDGNWNLYEKLFGSINFGDSEFSEEDNRGAIELPTYDILDLGLSYKMLLGENDDKSLKLRLNVNNAFDEVYLESASDNRHVDEGDVTWRGVNVDNRVRFGYGRTWNFSVRYNF